MEFPQYRKYKNNQSFFKILDKETFIEWKKSVEKWDKFEFKAAILPDRNYIQDMLTDYELYWDNITEKEYENFLQAIN